MEPKSLADLPFWFQLASGAGLFFGTFGLAVKGWFKGAEAKEPKNDAVVLSASLADGEQFGKLTRAVEALVVFLKDREEDADRHNNRIVAHLTDISEAVERQTKIFKDRTIL